MPSHVDKSTSHAEGTLHEVIAGKVEKPEQGEVSKPVVKTGEQKARKPTLRKYALLLAYQGKNYFGMQLQKNQETVESHLLDALHKCGYINDHEKNEIYSFRFQRAARTDKAVSAVRQTCSMFLPKDFGVNIDGHLKLNEFLPNDIRALGFRVATKGFHCQKDCSSRTYSYTVPSYTFAPTNELSTDDYRLSPEQVGEVNEILNIYKGTHNFFNYTSKRDSDDKSCIRYIIDFKLGEPYKYVDDIHKKEHEFVTVYIKGQSFMLHQIRKMIGMTIAVIRGFTTRSEIQRTFEGIRMDVPKAPGLGLVLEQVHYDAYDKRWNNSHPTLDNWGEEVDKEIEKLKMTLVYKEIFETECHNFHMMQWLADMDKHDFPSEPSSELIASEEVSGINLVEAVVNEAGPTETIAVVDILVQEEYGKLKEEITESRDPIV
uniref:tRNA pseudouridine synthase n=1 Tax=Rhabditophanes sp. KR3021 TaxID=114890 RepID=A0AC35TUW9_9BILA